MEPPSPHYTNNVAGDDASLGFYCEIKPTSRVFELFALSSQRLSQRHPVFESYPTVPDFPSKPCRYPTTKRLKNTHI